MPSSKYNSPSPLSSPVVGNIFPSCNIRIGNEPFLKTSVSSLSSSPKSLAMMTKMMKTKRRQRPYYGNQYKNINNNKGNNNRRKSRFADDTDKSVNAADKDYKGNNYNQDADDKKRNRKFN